MEPEHVRTLLRDLGTAVREAVVEAARIRGSALREVVAHFEEDEIFAGDVVAEEVTLRWLAEHWPEPVEIVMEGHRAEPVPDATGTLLIDPIDGTRGIVADKRSAWFLVGYAPVVGEARLSDLTVAAMTEIPPQKQTLADDWSAIAGAGPEGVVGRRTDVRTGEWSAIEAHPHTGTDVERTWACVAMSLHPGIRDLARCSAAVFEALGSPTVFHDQYLCSGGQIHEVFTGRDSFVFDPRVLLPESLSPHPYDVTPALIARELGCVVTDLDGTQLDAPIDTATNIGWIAIANEAMAERVLPVILSAIDETLR